MARNRNHIHSALCLPRYSISIYITTNPKQRQNAKKFHGCRYSTKGGFHHPNSLQPTASTATKHDTYQPTAHKPFQAIGRVYLLLVQEREGKKEHSMGSALRLRQELETLSCNLLWGIITGIADFSITYTEGILGTQLPALTAGSGSNWQ